MRLWMPCYRCSWIIWTISRIWARAMNQRAALYLRSSKDRSDVSIDSQRRELRELANKKGLLITQEFADVVESAKSENRPQFQKLITDLESPSRNWDTVLMIDHSRLSRQPYVGHLFRYECQKKGVDVVFSSMPELDPISKIIMDNVLDAFAVVHSIMSKQKGLAGMAENVRRGYRAGGRAPRGYRLQTIHTGAIREGQEVTKSTLVTAGDAQLVKRYLAARAKRVPRAQLKQELSLPWAAGSLVDMEWNALTYAGHTVWNVRNETLPGGGYKGGTKRKPRAEWMVQESTHEALITAQEAETILTSLENSSHRKTRARSSDYLLTGILITPDGDHWHGETNRGKKYYRFKPGKGGTGKGKTVDQELIESTVIRQVMKELQSKRAAKALAAAARKATQAQQEDPAADLRKQEQSLARQISKLMDIVVQVENSGPVLAKVDELEANRLAISTEVSRVDQERQASQALAGITPEQVQVILRNMADQLADATRDRIKGLLRNIVEAVRLDPDSLDCQIKLKVGAGRRDIMASPRGVVPIPALQWVKRVKLAA